MIKLLKSGKYGLGGVNVVEMVAGQVKDFGPVENFNLVSIGWAEWHKEQVKAESKPVEQEKEPEQDKPARGRPKKS